MNNDHKTTALDLVKDGVEMVVGVKAKGMLDRQIDDHTSLSSDNTFVGIGTLVAGQLIAHNLKPITDGAIDFAATNAKRVWNLKNRVKKTAE